MSIAEPANDAALEGELIAVAKAAGARLRAETDQDAEAARAAADELVRSASAAMAAGHSLTAIAHAEAHGKDSVRQALRGDALKLVERSGERAREMRREHHEAIARATTVGAPNARDRTGRRRHARDDSGDQQPLGRRPVGSQDEAPGDEALDEA